MRDINVVQFNECGVYTHMYSELFKKMFTSRQTVGTENVCVVFGVGGGYIPRSRAIKLEESIATFGGCRKVVLLGSLTVL